MIYIEIYHSVGYNRRVDTHTGDTAMFKASWGSNPEEITSELNLIVNGNGTFEDVYLLSEYVD